MEKPATIFYPPFKTTSKAELMPSTPHSNARKYWLLFVITSVVLVVVTELVLRLHYGFTDAILFRDDRNFEYIATPQDRHRFGKHVFYNTYSQRSREILPADSVAVLGFGDSVLNGGSQTDHDSLATTRLSEYLSQKYRRPLLVLNISAGSWGPDNCYAYLKKYGNFRAKNILLVVSSHDAYDNITHEKVVGVQSSYPAEQYSFAIAEVIHRYLVPRITDYLHSTKSQLAAKKEGFQGDSSLVNKYHPGIAFNSGFREFKCYADSTNSKLLVYLHAEKKELRTNKYNAQGDSIMLFCRQNNIRLVKELDYHFKVSDYRDDNFHLSEQGQRHMYDVLKHYY